jgi:hypothetical protein
MATVAEAMAATIQVMMAATIQVTMAATAQTQDRHTPAGGELPLFFQQKFKLR